jgi:RNA polymerase sigma-70 factor (ECF subfamily)
MNASVDPYILQQASCRASLLVASAGFRSDDWDDLRQEMILDCLRRSPKYDPSRGDWQGFVRGVVRNHAAVLVTRRRRRFRREVLAEDLSPEEMKSGDDPLDFLANVAEHEFAAALQMSIDVERVMTGLPLQLKALALLLSKFSVIEVCAKTGKSRSRVYQMTRQLRDAFIRAGFRARSPKKSAVRCRSNSRLEHDAIFWAPPIEDAISRDRVRQ